jgi:hypothetical protein
MKTLSHTLHARVDAVCDKRDSTLFERDLARRCLRAERTTVILLALAIAILFALNGHWQAAPHALFIPVEGVPPSAQFGWAM